MNCRKCGNQISGNSKFCSNCGCPTELAPKKNLTRFLMPILIVVIIGLIGVLFINSKHSNIEQKNSYNASQTDADKIIGEWILIGEIDGYDGITHYIPEEQNYSVSMEFNKDGTFIIKHNDGGTIQYTYEVTTDGYIKTYDETGEPTDPDYEISWNNEELILAEYWHDGYFDENDEFIRNMKGPYDLDDDHDAIVLKKK